MGNILAKVKLALRITTNDFDQEITDLINACLIDLGIAGITEHLTISNVDPLVQRAVNTYCLMNFGDVNGVEAYDRLKASYDEQKAQMGMTTGYTTWQ